MAIFTEASRKIGTGHLAESIDLARLAGESGFIFSFWVDGNSPRSVLEKIPFSYTLFSSIDEAQKILSGKEFDAAVFNFRKINNNVLRSLDGIDLITVCIDELGGRRLDCDAIINSLAAASYHRYPGTSSSAKLYSGPEYLAISPRFREIRGRNRKFSGDIKEITVCMGGIDRTGATLNIVDALTGWKDAVRKNIILGAGFPYYPEINNKIALLKKHNFRIYRNVGDVAPFFSRSDVVFTAGGNTLYELACVGTPAIVLYEDEHEKENSLAFQRRGFGISLGRGANVAAGKILETLEIFDDPRLRNKHSSTGRKIVDGKGSHRILRIIKGLMEK